MKDLLETNPHLAELDLDWLYHLGFNSKDELVRTFSDVRHVVMHGAPHSRTAQIGSCSWDSRMRRYKQLAQEIDFRCIR